MGFPSFRRQRSNAVQNAEQLLTASTTAERLSKTLRKLRTNPPDLGYGDISRYQSILEEQLADARWNTDFNLNQLSETLGIKNTATVRVAALKLAPKAEAKAIASYREPEYLPIEPSIKRVRERRVQAREMTVRQTVTLAIGNRIEVTGRSPQQLNRAVQLILMASDGLIHEVASELSDRSVVLPLPLRGDLVDKKQTVRNRILELAGYAGALSGDVIGAISTVHDGQSHFDFLHDVGPAFAINVVSLAASSKGINNSMKDKARVEVMSNAINHMSFRIASHLGIPQHSSHDSAAHFDLDIEHTPTGVLERLLTKLENVRTQSSRIVLGNQEEPDIDQAYSVASDLLWKSTGQEKLSALESGSHLNEYNFLISGPATVLGPEL